jgi:hypothetical protein
MERIKRVIFKLLIVLIAVLFIDGGRSVFSASINIQILNAQDHINDIELPGQYSHSHLYDYEEWTVFQEIDFSKYSGNFIKLAFNQNPLVSEFHNSIWQPPENS